MDAAILLRSLAGAQRAIMAWAEGNVTPTQKI